MVGDCCVPALKNNKIPRTLWLEFWVDFLLHTAHQPANEVVNRYIEEYFRFVPTQSVEITTLLFLKWRFGWRSGAPLFGPHILSRPKSGSARLPHGAERDILPSQVGCTDRCV